MRNEECATEASKARKKCEQLLLKLRDAQKEIDILFKEENSRVQEDISLDLYKQFIDIAYSAITEASDFLLHRGKLGFCVQDIALIPFIRRLEVLSEIISEPKALTETFV